MKERTPINSQKTPQEGIPSQNVPPPIKSNHKNTKWLIVILLVVIILLFTGGIFAYFNITRSSVVEPIIDNRKPITDISPTTIADNTATWQTYRNEVYGFEFKYPNDWETKKTSYKSLEDCNTKPSFCDSSMGYNGVSLQPITENKPKGLIKVAVYKVTNQEKDIREYFNNKDYRCCGNNVKPTYLGDKIIQSNTVEIAGLRAYEIISPEDIPLEMQKRNWYVLQNNNDIYVIGFYVQNIEDVAKSEITFNQILSTFQFTDSKNTTRDQSDISISLFMNSGSQSADMVITAPDGRRIGKNPFTEKEYTEIEDASYGLEQLCADGEPSICQNPVLLFTYLRPQSGIYKITIFSTQDDRVSLETDVYDKNFNYKTFDNLYLNPKEPLVQEVNKGQTIEYLLDYNKEEINKSSIKLTNN